MGTASSKPTVALIVEDEFLVRMLAVDIFTDAGFEAIEAANADEALLILDSRGDIGVIFTDINMPGSIDGLSLAYVVSRRWPSIRIIVTSALRIPGNRALPVGSMFLEKPYQSSHIAGAVRALTRSSAWSAL
jgi:two-component system, response regulator PdtaR